MELFEAIANRHSVRSFKADPVPREKLARLFEAASQAPSSMNEQPWRFYVASGASRQAVGEIMAQSTSYLEEYMKLIGHEVTDEALRWYSELGGAPHLIACTMPRVDDDFARLNKQISIGGAVENLLLAVTEEGLGACSITFSFWVSDQIAEVLGVPEDRVIVCLVVLGFPDAEVGGGPPKTADVVTYLD